MADKKYKSNTLAGVAGNVAEDIKSGYQQAEFPIGKIIKQDYENMKKDMEKPNEILDKTREFVFGSPELNAQQGQRVVTDNDHQAKLNYALHKGEPYWDEQEQAVNAGAEQSAPAEANQTSEAPVTTEPTVATQPTVQTPASGGSAWQTAETPVGSYAQTSTPAFGSKEDVVYYLASNVTGWNSLSEDERVTMVEDLWNANAANGQSEGALPGNYSDNVVQGMQADLSTGSNGEQIFGKAGTEASGAITVSQDANGVIAAADKARMSNLKNFLLQKPYTVAASLLGGGSAYSEQLLTDAQKYAPEFWAQVQAEMKKITVGDTVNAIASGEPLPNTLQSSIDSVNSGVDSWARSVSGTPQQTQYTIQNASNAMANNQVATSAAQEILSIDAQIEEYKSKINNLVKEANTYFKGDAPQYVVNAYINNKSQKYQAEIEKLEGRRQSAMDLYKLEISNYQWGQEMSLKYQQLQRDLNNDTWDRWYKEQQLNKSNIHWENGKAYQVNSDGTVTQLSNATALYGYQNDVQNIINGYKSMYTSGGGMKTATGYKYGVCGLECEGFTDNFTEATTGLRMTGANGRAYTTAEEKINYINEDPGVVNVGDIAIAAGGVYDSTWGHTMIVTGYDPATGVVDLLWSNKDGDKTVYSTTDTLSNLYAKGLRGFWNPYKDMVEASATNNVGGYTAYGVQITPMTSKFDELVSKGVGVKSVSSAERIYDTIYRIQNDGSLDALINSGDFGKMWAYISKSQFANTAEDEGITFWNSLNDYKNKFMAKEFTGGEASINALNELMRLVESKLRKESGAVINSGEWRGAFELFLPRPGESAESQWNKLGGWDDYIIQLLREGGMDKKEGYIPLFPRGGKREIF